MNNFDGYSQFIYGRFSSGKGGYQIVAHTSDLAIQDMQEIAERYRFWGSKLPPAVTKTKAVGVFQKNEQLIFVQASSVSTSFGIRFGQHRYIIVPLTKIAELGYRSHKILKWFFQQEIPVYRQLNDDLQRLPISILEEHITSEERRKEAIIVGKCLKEKDHEKTSFLFSALLAIVNDIQVLINQTENRLSIETYYLVSILALLPATCRREISIAIGNIDESQCSWAKLILKTMNSGSVNRPQNCIWLNRDAGVIDSDGSLSTLSSKYVNKLEEILLNRPSSTLSILGELDQIKDESIRLSGLEQIEKLTFKKQAAQIRLGIWGAAGSGKTTYLAALYDCLQRSKGTLKVIAEDNRASIFIDRILTRIADGRFPEPTPEVKDLEIITFTLMQTASLAASKVQLLFVDAPGEYYAKIGGFDRDGNPSGAGIVWERGTDNDSSEETELTLIDYLIKCDGIIFMLSPFQDRTGSASYQDLLPRIFRGLRARALEVKDEGNDGRSILDDANRFKQFFAFCISQIDRGGYWEKREEANLLGKELLGNAVEKLSTFCLFDEKHRDDPDRNRCKFFAVSSIGRYLEADNDWREAFQSPQQDHAVDAVSEKEAPPDDSQPVQPKESPVDASEGIDDISSGWATQPNVESELGGEQSPKNYGETIRVGVNRVPFNVVEPIEWLIEKLQIQSNTR